jgi:hypothetical protein
MVFLTSGKQESDSRSLYIQLQFLPAPTLGHDHYGLLLYQEYTLTEEGGIYCFLDAAIALQRNIESLLHKK